jgi:hypothetical protein
VSQRLFEGDIITEEMIGTEAQVFARIYVKAKNAVELRAVVIEILAKIKIFNSEGESLLISGFNPKNIN